MTTNFYSGKKIASEDGCSLKAAEDDFFFKRLLLLLPALLFVCAGWDKTGDYPLVTS